MLYYNTFNETKLNIKDFKINKKLKMLLFQIGEIEFRSSIFPSEEHIIFSLEKYILEMINISTIQKEKDGEKIRNNIKNIEV